MTRRAVIYTRISSDRTGQKAGVRRQETECRALADRLGWDVVGVQSDNDVSAYRGKPRPGYERMIATLTTGTADAVIAWHPDRLTRQTRELEDFIDTVEATGADVATVTAGTYDLSSPAGRMTARVIGATARYESEQKSERHRSKARQLAADGKVGGGGTRPFGFDEDRVTVRDDEAEVIRDAARLILGGRSLRSVVRELNDRDVQTVTGRQWSAQTVRRMLTGPRWAGLREHRGEVVGDAEWPAVLDRATWEAVRAVLSDPARRTNRNPTKYLLRGLVFLYNGREMIARPNDRGARRYVAPGAPDLPPGGAILAEPLEAEVEWRLCDAYADATLPAAEPVDVDAVADVARLEADLDDLARLHGEGEVSTREWVASRAPLVARLDAAKARAVLSAPAGPVLPEGNMHEVWPSLSFDQRRDVVVAVVDRVTIGPAVRGRNYFDPDRVSIDWKV